MAEGIARKIARMVSGKRMNVMTPRTFPRKIKKRRIIIK